MKNLHPRDVPVVRDLPSNLMCEIGRVIVFHSYVEWRLDLIICDFLRVTKVLGRLVSKDVSTIDQFDLICDLISLRNAKIGVDLIDLRKSLLLASTQRDLLVHGTWVKNPKTKAFVLNLSRVRSKPAKSNKMRKKRPITPDAPEYGIKECRTLSQLIIGIILTVDELYSDTLNQAVLSRQKLH
jgi:hypothetical protein